jgi:hypothetical protein
MPAALAEGGWLSWGSETWAAVSGVGTAQEQDKAITIRELEMRIVDGTP